VDFLPPAFLAIVCSVSQAQKISSLHCRKPLDISKAAYPDEPEGNSNNAAVMADNLRMQLLKDGKTSALKPSSLIPVK
jgi:hypothetical protein